MNQTFKLYAAIGSVCIFLLSVVGAFFYGKHVESVDWELKQSKNNERIAELEAKAEKVKTQEVIKYVDRVKIVKEKGDTIVETVTKFITVDNACPVTNGFARLHDAAATNTDIGNPNDTDGAASEFTNVEVAQTVAENYSTCHQIREQLIALQTTIKSIHELNVKNLK